VKTKTSDTQKLELLTARTQLGDPKAFGELYDLMAPAIYRYLYFKLRMREDAEDIAAETWQKVWLKLTNKGYENRNFTGWLYRVAYTTMIDYLRKKQPEIHEALPEQLAAEGKDLSEKAAQQDEQEKLLQTVRSLEQPYQDIIWLRFVEELSIAETAMALGKPSLVIRVYQHRALQKLKKLLQLFVIPV
jgi:RNA polymerase sigma-70 factor, ECF subfamily